MAKSKKPKGYTVRKRGGRYYAKVERVVSGKLIDCRFVWGETKEEVELRVSELKAG